jgi:hypothetical protein
VEAALDEFEPLIRAGAGAPAPSSLKTISGAVAEFLD